MYYDADSTATNVGCTQKQSTESDDAKCRISILFQEDSYLNRGRRLPASLKAYEGSRQVNSFNLIPTHKSRITHNSHSNNPQIDINRGFQTRGLVFKASYRRLSEEVADHLRYIKEEMADEIRS